MDIDTVIFDFGGVLYLTPTNRKMQFWLKLMGISQDPELSAVFTNSLQSSLFWEIMRGQVPEKVLWQKIAQKGLLAKLITSYITKRSQSKKLLNLDLIEYLKKIKSTYHTAILSNAGDESRKLMENHLALNHLVDQIIISAEEGVAKPDPELYSIACQKLHTVPDRCIFVDDLEENIKTATALGMHAIHHKDNDQTLSQLHALLPT